MSGQELAGRQMKVWQAWPGTHLGRFQVTQTGPSVSSPPVTPDIESVGGPRSPGPCQTHTAEPGSQCWGRAWILNQTSGCPSWTEV